MQLYHIRDPVFDKKKLTERDAGYLRQVNPEAEFLAMQPRFSRDFSKLAYVARDTKFLGHTSCYQLKQMAWPLANEAAPASETVIDRVMACPSD